MLFNLYSRLVLNRPAIILLLITILVLFLASFVPRFRMDASADTLVVEGDADLEYSRTINERYGTGDFVFVTYNPEEGLFTASALERLKSLKNELEDLPRVENVDSIFDVPLFKVANVSLSEIADNILTLEDEGIDLDQARDDLVSSEAYRNVLLSEDGETTALIVNIAADTVLDELLTKRTELREKANTENLAPETKRELDEVEKSYTDRRKIASQNLHQDILSIRSILDRYESQATIHLGGVPMIADDLITFVRNDLVTFGSAILAFIIVALSFLFRKVRYVFTPLLCGFVISVCVIGVLGLFDWPVTVISSNFLSLLLIITVSLTVHLIVRYRELEVSQPALDHKERLRRVLRSMIVPCAYTSLTTIVAFGSLLISEIPPIIDFGWMMVMGVCFAFVLTFLIFPSVNALLKESQSQTSTKAIDITPAIGRFTARNGSAILLVSGILLIFTVFGLNRLKVENSFIDYFDESTEIYQGMLAIDQNMGGTTPLDVIIDMSTPNPFDNPGENVEDALYEDDFFEDEFFEDEYYEEEEDSDAYWFTRDKMDRLIEIHDYLESMPETGKVLSLATLIKIAYELNDDSPLNSIELAVLYNRIPEQYKESLLKPYVSVAQDQVRFSVRVLETSPGLVRSELLQKIRSGLVSEFGFDETQIHLTGMLVLYNNMLQSLFESQIATLALVLLAIMIMFLILFRSLKLAIIGIIPNVLAALSVLGLMGWLSIPLDMMTITIAAISIGIGVDNTIHYMHRFKTSFPEFNDYEKTMLYCHGSIGKAMYYTSFTIVIGFSILILSNFIPTIYFGLLTSLAMCLALAGALTLLPRLILLVKPFS